MNNSKLGWVLGVSLVVGVVSLPFMFRAKKQEPLVQQVTTESMLASCTHDYGNGVYEIFGYREECQNLRAVEVLAAFIGKNKETHEVVSASAVFNSEKIIVITRKK